MRRGVVFFSNSCQPMACFYVAVHSLRKHYNGPIGLVYSNLGEVFVEAIKESGIICVPFSGHLKEVARRKYNWIAKAQCHMDNYPFDVNLYYDADHLFLRSVTDAMFDLIEEHQLVAASTMEPPGHWQRKLERLNAILGLTLNEIYGMNGGCVGAVKGCQRVKEWMEWISRLNRSSGTYKKNPEEWGASVMASLGKAKLVGRDWSNTLIEEEQQVEGQVATHYSVRRGWKSAPWLKEAREVVRENYMRATNLNVFGNSMLELDKAEAEK